MTPHQLHLLDCIVSFDGRISKPEREAVRAILAERESAVAVCQMIVDYHHSSGEDVEFTDILDAATDAVDQANGGPPCGG